MVSCWWCGPVGLLFLAILQKLNRHNVIGLLLWAPFHCLVALPLRHQWGRLTGAPAPPFSWRAQSLIDATKYCTREFEMGRMRSSMDMLVPVSLARSRCALEPVQPSNPGAASLLSGSLWFGSGGVPNADTRVLIYCHGGGFCVGNAHMYPGPFRHMMDEAKASGISLRILSVHYPLATESGREGAPDSRFASNGYQRAIETVVAAYDYVRDEIGVPSHSILLGGDSAGGNLAVTTCIALRDRARRQGVRDASKLAASMPAGLVLFSPLTDVSPTARWRTRHDPQDPHYVDNLDYLHESLVQRFTRIFLGNSKRYAVEARERGVRGWIVGEPEEATGGGDPSNGPSSSAAPARVASPRALPVVPSDAADLSSFHLVSPFYADLSALPPVHMCYGGRELLEVDIRDFGAALLRAGVSTSETFHPLMTHNYALTREAFGRTADAAMSSVTDFIVRTLSAQKPTRHAN